MLPACGAQEEAEPATAVPEPTTESVDNAAVDEAESEEEPTAVVEESENSSPEPTEAPTEEAEVDKEPTEAASNEVLASSPEDAAEIRASDWVKGSENPEVVIIEYGDFQ